jgi:hypothetical protein
MPVEALTELVAYRELVLGVAKELFRESHPSRQRVPRGFADRLQLRLRTIEDGSAMPVLERVVADGRLLEIDDEFTESRDVIEAAVAAVANGERLPEGFPAGALVLFNHFGQTLREGEAIELRRGNAVAGPQYTPAVRKALVLTESPFYQEEIQGIGWVWEVDGNRMSAQIRLQFGAPTPVPAPLDEVTFGPVKEVLAPNGEGPPVRISGTGVFDANHRLIRFDSIHDVTVRDDSEDIALLDTRLDELGFLGDGWLDGDGAPVNPVALALARRILTELLGFDVPRPSVFATPSGGVQAEWTIERYETSVTFEADGSLSAMSVHGVSGSSDEPQLSEDAEQIARFVLRVP